MGVTWCVLLLSFLTCFASATVAPTVGPEEECNILSGDEFVELVVGYPFFTEADISGEDQTIHAPIPVELVDGSLRISSVDEEDGSGDSAASFWLQERVRLADGFVVEFEFNLSGSSDGFAFVAQNDRIQNIEGNVGAALGVKAGLNNFLAVGFDLCPDRSTCSGDYLVSVIRDPAITINSTTISPSKIQTNGTLHSVRIAYAPNIDLFRIELDSDVILETKLGANNPLTIWGEDRFAYIGFTASNAGSDPATIDIQSLILSKFISEARLRAGTAARNLQVGSSASIIIDIVDSCNQISNEVAAVNNITLDSIVTNLVFDPAGQAALVPPVSITSQSNATFIVVFQIDFLGSYGLQAAVNGVQVQGTPTDLLYTGVDTFSLPPYAIALLAILLIVIAMSAVFAIRRLLRYRRKLKENQEAIEYGYERDHLDKLEQNVIWKMNPLLGDINDMRQKLKDNEEELRRMREKNGEMDDPQFHLAQLERENQELLEELNALKKADQQEGVFNFRKSIRLFNPNKDRKEFKQQRASVAHLSSRIRDMAQAQQAAEDEKKRLEEEVESLL